VTEPKSLRHDELVTGPMHTRGGITLTYFSLHSLLFPARLLIFRFQLLFGVHRNRLIYPVEILLVIGPTHACLSSLGPDRAQPAHEFAFVKYIPVRRYRMEVHLLTTKIDGLRRFHQHLVLLFGALKILNRVWCWRPYGYPFT
jgi:hypothetical protein